MLAAGILIAGSFLSNIFLGIFTFFITNAGTIAVGMSSKLQVSIFAILLIKIAMP